MTAQKHTPGAYKVTRFADGTFGISAPDGNTRMEVATLRGRFAEGNAYRLAAAPEMLEALKECLPLFDMVTALDDHGSNALGQAENIIRAAIAKATGQ